MRIALTYPAIIGAALALAACASGDPAMPGGLTLIELPLRVHVLSSRVDQIDSDATDAQVGALLDRSNQIWARAGIRFTLDLTVREAIGAEAEIEAALAGGPVPLSVIAGGLPRGELSGGRWDAFIVDDLTALSGAPGVFVPSIPALVSSEVDPAGINDPGRILAHELGHSLTLEHVDCPPEGNLMAAGCPGTDRGRLTDAQIEAARAKAETGRPVPF
ncbi:MAG: hypothetical protein ABFS34_14915 [Gemmatimonadota bacterium]